ncbi:hypothetical protein BRADI_5g17572v3 [Brachypodium distachyon]|uniref:Uncharacterized protein n=1 Tax=Brachypodium distachyon TaxID=15368 RepID=A0A2K2CHU9_BRADI|nr:hypothetical protein BRADI_5g17572v3 [Brachypodium distachyon]
MGSRRSLVILAERRRLALLRGSLGSPTTGRVLTRVVVAGLAGSRARHAMPMPCCARRRWSLFFALCARPSCAGPAAMPVAMIGTVVEAGLRAGGSRSLVGRRIVGWNRTFSCRSLS